jgi:hypothetical protein
MIFREFLTITNAAPPTDPVVSKCFQYDLQHGDVHFVVEDTTGGAASGVTGTYRLWAYDPQISTTDKWVMLEDLAVAKPKRCLVPTTQQVIAYPWLYLQKVSGDDVDAALRAEQKRSVTITTN